MVKTIRISLLWGLVTLEHVSKKAHRRKSVS